MKQGKHLSIIVNSFNRACLMPDCLGALARWLPDNPYGLSASVHIYDAGSTDGTEAWVREHASGYGFPIHFIDGRDDADRSFSAGLNRGVAHALDLYPKTDYLLFYETDNQILSAEPVSQGIGCLEAKDRLGACGFTVKLRDGQAAGVGMPFPKLWHFLLGKTAMHKLKLERVRYAWEDRGSIRFSPVDVVFTSPLLVKPDAWRASGGMDAAHFPFSECDVDWAKRLRDLGWTMGVVESTEAIHDNADAISGWSKNRAVHYHRGRLNYFRIHQPVRTALVAPHFLALRHLFERIFVALAVRDPERRRHLGGVCSRLLGSVWKGYQE
ncbi:glycosyltransferase family 2 protein [Coraliomargarita parva]|uniref:glycosyltransferase family 2 protein n=1 Tax=Coraliomargarita parva TaxID=3014050 RepID=UPI0022B56D50|nr:glycosyltransferase [Coraliomargarita parva]